MQQLCIYKMTLLYNIYPRIMPEVNVSATVGEMSATVGEMTATVNMV